MNFQRTVRRKNEESIWMGWARNQGLRRMTNAGHVTGISDVTQGRGLDVKPYGLVTAQASPGRGVESFDRDGNAGVDLFYNPTPLLRTVFTVNTDFAQTEVDQRQVNLTRFSLFFPERRDFFLDGATFFDFGSPTDADLRINPFFSRRIGLSANATPQPINFGTKVTGQVGGQDVGLLHVQTGHDEDDALIGEDFTVARAEAPAALAVLHRRACTRAATGASTAREARHTPASMSASRPTASSGRRISRPPAGSCMRPRPDLASGNSAFGAALAYPNDLWDARFEVSEVQANFDPAIGFVTRHNYRRYAPQLAWQPRPDGHRYIRRFVFSGDGDLQTDLDNRLLTRALNLTLTEVQFHSQETVGVRGEHHPRTARRAVRDQSWHHAPARRPVRLQRYASAARPRTGACWRSTDGAAGASSIPARARKRSSISTSASGPATSST